MICNGCGNSGAYVTKTYAGEAGLLELCNARNCGNLKTPWVPDVFFPGPHFSEHLADADHPQGQVIESKRHKAQVLAKQGLREDGDHVHGSVFRDASAPPKGPTPQFKKKLRDTVLRAMKKA